MGLEKIYNIDGYRREKMNFNGQSREKVWETLSKEIHADYIKGGFWTGDKVQAHVDNWIIVLDTYTITTVRNSTTYTRIRAPFVNLTDFYFKIYRKGIFSDFGKLIGMQDITVGYDKFDEDFVIQGNSEEKVRQLFNNERIRSLIEAEPSINLEIKNDEGFFSTHFPEGVDELHFYVEGVISDIKQLKELYELFADILKELCIIGAASSEGPGVNL